jgi:hypothetical protein
MLAGICATYEHLEYFFLLRFFLFSSSAKSDVQENYVAQQQSNPNLCEQAVSRPRPSMYMDDLLNHLSIAR